MTKFCACFILYIQIKDDEMVLKFLTRFAFALMLMSSAWHVPFPESS